MNGVYIDRNNVFKTKEEATSCLVKELEKRQKYYEKLKATAEFEIFSLSAKIV